MEIITYIKNRLPDVCKKEDIGFVGLFGSIAKGKGTKKSDIDLLVRFYKRKSLLDIVRIERELSEMLKRKVDLLTESSISPYLKNVIISELKVLYER